MSDITQINGNSLMPIGKYKGLVIADIARSNIQYIEWFQINTKYDIIDYEAITGRAKPVKVYQPTQQPTAVPTPQTMYGQHPVQNHPPQQQYVPQGRKVIPTPQGAQFTESDFENLKRSDFIYIVHLLRSKYKAKYGESLLDASVNTTVVLPQQQGKVYTEGQNINTPQSPKIDGNDEDDLPF